MIDAVVVQATRIGQLESERDEQDQGNPATPTATRRHLWSLVSERIGRKAGAGCGIWFPM
jgi:hypothetical protein